MFKAVAIPELCACIIVVYVLEMEGSYDFTSVVVGGAVVKFCRAWHCTGSHRFDPTVIRGHRRSPSSQSPTLEFCILPLAAAKHERPTYDQLSDNPATVSISLQDVVQGQFCEHFELRIYR